MDDAKCRKLKEELAHRPDPPVVPIDRFFDGNDDLGSIGCNLIRHPGIEVFRDVLVGLAGRPDVEAVYALIAEVDPGEGSWPFADTVLVAGDIPVEELRSILEPLGPDEVGPAANLGVPHSVATAHRGRLWAAWWD